MTLLSAHHLLPIQDGVGRRGARLLYLDHAGLSDRTSWRRRVRARIGAAAYGLFCRPRF